MGQNAHVVLYVLACFGDLLVLQNRLELGYDFVSSEVLALAADRGPWGFAPAIKDVREWLDELKTATPEPTTPETTTKE